MPYFFVTFTVPEELRRFLRSHLQIGLDLLFAASARSLQDLAGNPRRLGAHLGMLGVLHTWSRTLLFHPHIHYLVPGGGLSADGRRWVKASPEFLLHHQALGEHCRTLFKNQLFQHHPELFKEVPAKVWTHHWNVGCQAAGSGENALRYLSRYVFKTATGNRKVQILPGGQVRWPYRESKTGKWTALHLEPHEFLRRFLQHILPPHFARVRTFGWFHPAARVRLNRVRALLRQEPVLTPAEEQTWKPPLPPEQGVVSAPLPQPATKDTPPFLCPRCQKAMRRVGSWQAGQVMVFPNRPP